MSENLDKNEKDIENTDISEMPETSESEDGVTSSEAEGLKPDTEEKEEKRKKSPFREMGEWILAILIALAVTLVLKNYVFDTVVVDGESMLHTLEHHDRMIMVKCGYEPERGDVIVLDSHYKTREAYIAYKYENYPDFGAWDEFKLRYISFGKRKQLGIQQRCYVKRVIALEGDVVDIDSESGRVLVNGEYIDEPYLDDGMPTYEKDMNVTFPHTVADGCVFVMGDNRENSTDSRMSALGDVPVEAVLGKASFRFWPVSSFGTIE